MSKETEINYFVIAKNSWIILAGATTKSEAEGFVNDWCQEHPGSPTILAEVYAEARIPEVPIWTFKNPRG